MLLGFTGFFTRFYWVWLVFTGFDRVGPGFSRFLPGSMGLLTQFHWLKVVFSRGWPASIRLTWDGLAFTGFFTGFFFTGFDSWFVGSGTIGMWIVGRNKSVTRFALLLLSRVWIIFFSLSLSLSLWPIVRFSFVFLFFFSFFFFLRNWINPFNGGHSTTRRSLAATSKKKRKILFFFASSLFVFPFSFAFRFAYLIDGIVIDDDIVTTRLRRLGNWTEPNGERVLSLSLYLRLEFINELVANRRRFHPNVPKSKSRSDTKMENENP